jgi:transposase
LAAAAASTPGRVEATGGYEQAALDALFAAGLPMVRANPRQVRDFAEALGQAVRPYELADGPSRERSLAAADDRLRERLASGRSKDKSAVVDRVPAS